MQVVTDISTSQNLPCVGTIGFFDGVHRGHRFLLEQVKEEAYQRNIATSVITFSTHPRKVLQSSYQPELLSTTDEKLSLLEQTGMDYCVLLPFTQALSMLSAKDFMELLRDRYHVEALVIGYDHRFGHHRTESFQDYFHYGKELGIDVVLAKEYEISGEGGSVSSSVIRSFLKEGRVDEANDRLGYAYSLKGTIIDGHHIGREIGFPTANIQVSPMKLIPADGVYAVYVYVEGNKYVGMLNIGSRPTMQNGTERSIEVHILDFSENIYEKEIKVELVRYVRAEHRYNQIKELVEQMKKDKELISSIL